MIIFPDLTTFAQLTVTLPFHSYVQFHPLMYLIKLKIEMNMADLIIKIVKATSPAPGHELHRYAATNSIVRPGGQRPGLAADSRITSDSTSNTKKSTIPSSNSQTNILPEVKRRESDRSNKDNDDGWVLTRLPSNFDAGDVVDTRKVSVTEGSVGMVPLATLMRPALMRNMSEMTQLEVGAGYLDRDVRDKRTSGSVEQSPV